MKAEKYTASKAQEARICAIWEAVEEATGLARADILANTRTKEVCDARLQVISALRRELPTWGTVRIGAVVKRDHSAVISALRKIDARLQACRDFQYTHAKVAARINVKAKKTDKQEAAPAPENVARAQALIAQALELLTQP